MERRQLLRLLMLSGAFGVARPLPAIASEQNRRWGYVGADGPDVWGNLSPDFGACGTGHKQSPIDLSSAFAIDSSDVAIAYQSIPLAIRNTGYTVQVDAPAGNGIRLDGDDFELRQLHFHTPSEHTVDGVQFPMELHLVHQSATGDLAVVGIFLTEGEPNAALQPIWDQMPINSLAAKLLPDAPVAIAELLPEKRSLFRYFGSLTTPPCSEIVKWVVFQTPVEVSTAQIEAFQQAFGPNARPIQPLYQRRISENLR